MSDREEIADQYLCVICYCTGQWAGKMLRKELPQIFWINLCVLFTVHTSKPSIKKLIFLDVCMEGVLLWLVSFTIGLALILWKLSCEFFFYFVNILLHLKPLSDNIWVFSHKQPMKCWNAATVVSSSKYLPSLVSWEGHLLVEISPSNQAFILPSSQCSLPRTKVCCRVGFAGLRVGKQRALLG